GCAVQCGGGDASATADITGNPVFTQTKTADRASYLVGQPITYTITIANTGSGPGTATVTDTVPAGVGSVGVACSATGTGTCTTAGSAGSTLAGAVHLGPDEAAVFTVTGVVVGGASATNLAVVTPTTPGCTTQCGGGDAGTPTLEVNPNPVF